MSRYVSNQPQNGQTTPDFETLFLRHRKSVYWLAHRMLSNPSDAEDVVQDAFLRAWGSYSRFDPTESFEAWIYRIASNLCLDRIRRRKRRREISLDLTTDSGRASWWDGREILDTTFSPDRCVLAILEGEVLKQVINDLSPAHRDVVFLLQQERSYAEISEILDCPVGTVRSRLHRARVKMRKALAHQLA